MEDVNTHVDGSFRRLAPLLERYKLKLVPASPDRFVDALVEVPTSEGPTRLPLVASAIRRFDLQPSDLTLLKKSSAHGILAVEDQISRKRAREYRELGIAHLDLTGNGWLDLPGFKLWIDRPEQARPHKKLPVPTSARALKHLPSSKEAQPNRAYTPAGARLVFVLLVAPDRAGAPLRELAHLAGISLGATAEAVQGLVDDGHLLAGDPQRQLLATAQLAAKWIESFRTRLLPSIKTLGFGGTALSDVLEYVTDGSGSEMVAGEAIAHRIRRHQTITVYSDWPPTALVRKLELQRNRDDPTIFIREKFWHTDLFAEPTPIAPELLTAAELIASGEPRQRDAAWTELNRIGLSLQ